MTNAERETFIEEMDNLNDHWELHELIGSSYDNMSLDEALRSRRYCISLRDNITAIVSNIL